MPSFLICCLAREMRRLIDACGTMKARAISSVVSPPTARRVSATCEDCVSTGWQHMNRRIRVSSSAETTSSSSGAGASDASGSAIDATVASRARRAASLRQ
ncbi:hypothetical protein [Streptomyces sp. SolWspMP-sol7th]|uniref:hypothetical protein n=1 Tax=Streptomyces sp. SolWspMP-sol7th TaxID=1839776 RepID=UPI0034A0CBAD